MQDRCERLHAVDEPRAWSGQVDRDDPAAQELGGHELVGLRQGVDRWRPTRREDDDLWIGAQDLVPARGSRTPAGIAEQRLAATAVEVLGPTLQHAEAVDAAENDFWHETYLYSRAASVYGGTGQIQRNIIADRILALPQE